MISNQIISRTISLLFPTKVLQVLDEEAVRLTMNVSNQEKAENFYS